MEVLLQDRDLEVNYKEIAQEIINCEIKGLKELSHSLDENFSQAIDIILECSGRVILSGMGKSGHIAKKIAATLASTGTTSYFVHPSEASHGDLGMITKNDVVILLSNSGETRELKDIIYYCQRFTIPIISMCRVENSSLAKNSNIALVLPGTKEAFPAVDAPTTSCIMMLAVGDAIAGILAKAKGFGGDDYKILHPGGKLGSSLLKVSDLMNVGDKLPMISCNQTIKDAIQIITEKKLGSCCVIDDFGKLIGIITDGDLRRNLGNELLSKNVKDVMTKNPIVIQGNQVAAKALAIMEEKSITAIYVVDEMKCPVGIIHIHDCLRAGVV
jgi:arabinose-5-phosphate isomerase